MRIKTLERHVLVWQPLAWDWRRNLTLSPRPVVPSGFTQAPHSIRFLGEVKVNSCSETSLSTIWACPGSELSLSPPVTDVTWSCSELLGTEAACVGKVGTRAWSSCSQ